MLFSVHFVSCIIHLTIWEREKDIKVKQLLLKYGSMSFVNYLHKQFQLALNLILGGKCSDKFANRPHYAIRWFDLRRKGKVGEALLYLVSNGVVNMKTPK